MHRRFILFQKPMLAGRATFSNAHTRHGSFLTKQPLRWLLQLHAQPVFVALLLYGVANSCHAQTGKITAKNLAFIAYPDFPEAHSTWGDIGYSNKYNKVVIGVTNHKDNIGLYEYDVASKKIQLKGFVNEMARLRPFQWQAKIHSKITEGGDGAMYFSTDGGESREEYLMEHPQGYGGGFFMKWNPGTGQLTNLGMGLKYESIKDVDIDPHTGVLYGVSYPQAHFLVYDPAKNDFQDLGRLGSPHVARVLFTDWWGNCYYVDWRQRLVKYEKANKALVFAEESLPAFPHTPGYKIVTGITAYAKDQKNGIIYLVTYGAKVLAFHPQQQGIGKVDDLGGVIETGSNPPYSPYVPNLNLGNNGKLYYIIGGHGNYVADDKSVLVEMDPKTGQRQILFRFTTSEVTEATGSNIKDREGNLYFAGRRGGEIIENSTPFLIKFNPQKAVQ